MSQPRETTNLASAPESTLTPDLSTALEKVKVTKSAPTVPGTYEMAATENVEALAPGDVRILSPAPTSVSMSPGLQIEARVALNWTIRLEVNGEQVSDKNIGVRSLDHKNQVSTFTFVGLGVRPGPNRIRCTAINPDGTAGRT